MSVDVELDWSRQQTTGFLSLGVARPSIFKVLLANLPSVGLASLAVLQEVSFAALIASAFKRVVSVAKCTFQESLLVASVISILNQLCFHHA